LWHQLTHGRPVGQRGMKKLCATKRQSSISGKDTCPPKTGGFKKKGGVSTGLHKPKEGGGKKTKEIPKTRELKTKVGQSGSAWGGGFIINADKRQWGKKPGKEVERGV